MTAMFLLLDRIFDDRLTGLRSERCLRAVD